MATSLMALGLSVKALEPLEKFLLLVICDNAYHDGSFKLDTENLSSITGLNEGEVLDVFQILKEKKIVISQKIPTDFSDHLLNF